MQNELGMADSESLCRLCQGIPLEAVSLHHNPKTFSLIKEDCRIITPFQLLLGKYMLNLSLWVSSHKVNEWGSVSNAKD